MNEQPIEHVAGDSVYINQSRLSDFINCQELYRLTWEHGKTGLKPKQLKLHFEVGTAYHEAIARYYENGRDVDGAIQVSTDRINASIAKAKPMLDEVGEWNDTIATLSIMIQKYHERYKNEPLTVIAPEAKGCVRLGNSPHFLVFRTDAIFQRYGTIGLFDYKTSKISPSSQVIARIHTNIQPTAYCYGVSASTGMHVEGLEYRWAVKKPEYPSSRMHVAEWTGRTAKDLKRFEDEAIWACEEILKLRKSGRWLHNWNQCTTYGECEMRRVCLHHRDPATIALYDQREADYVVEASTKETST